METEEKFRAFLLGTWRKRRKLKFIRRNPRACLGAFSSAFRKLVVVDCFVVFSSYRFSPPPTSMKILLCFSYFIPVYRRQRTAIGKGLFGKCKLNALNGARWKWFHVFFFCCFICCFLFRGCFAFVSLENVASKKTFWDPPTKSSIEIFVLLQGFNKKLHKSCFENRWECKSHSRR